MHIKKENYNSKKLVELWANFVDWEKRRKGENGFLVKNLKAYKCQNILDACLGDGADSIYLLKNGFAVTSNDIDSEFIKKAKENAKKYKVTLNITTFDWKEFDKRFKENEFDAVLCEGNSITYLFSKNDRLKTIQNFRSIIKKQGILIIDERNYQYILDRKEDILTKNKFNYSGKYVYCGNRVHGIPLRISSKAVTFEYTDQKTGKKGQLTLYPFKKGELLDLLKEAGFTAIKQYSDYKSGFNPDADFYQYVCIK